MTDGYNYKNIEEKTLQGTTIQAILLVLPVMPVYHKSLHIY